jgi:hypothetical protein
MPVFADKEYLDMSSTASLDNQRPSASRWAPLSGIAFVVFFVGSVVASAPPADNAPDREWIAAYTSHAKQIGHLATGILLVLAALSLMTLLVTLWTRVAQARRPASLNPLPLVAAGVAAACISIGGVLMAGISGAMLTGSAPLPSVELLRFGNDIGFGAVGLGGMLATALSVACLSVQAHSAHVFGRKMMIFGLAVAVILLGALAFVPIVALLIWLVVVSITLIRSGADATSAPTRWS